MSLPAQRDQHWSMRLGEPICSLLDVAATASWPVYYSDQSVSTVSLMPTVPFWSFEMASSSTMTSPMMETWAVDSPGPIDSSPLRRLGRTVPPVDPRVSDELGTVVEAEEDRCSPLGHELLEA